MKKVFYLKRFATKILAIFLILGSHSCNLNKDIIDPSQIIEIPIVFHILHDGTQIGVGKNIVASRISQQLSILNRNYANAKIQFRLATKDVNDVQMKEPGINRIRLPYSPAYSIFDYQKDPNIKQLIWDPNNYLNIVLVDVVSYFSGGAFSPFPSAPPRSKLTTFTKGPQSDDANDYPDNRCIIMNYKTIRGDMDEYLWNEFDLPHEIGHYFGLLHIFGYKCIEDADWCDDTYNYNQKENNNAQNETKVLCDGQRKYADNIMDYLSTRQIRSMRFTTCQNEYMRKCISLCFILRNLNKSEK
ncbi:MAG: M43 family zinc metalloprotease [Leadbetterella sp.]